MQGEHRRLKGDAPRWVQMFPSSRTVRARDGRRWTLSDPQTVIDRSLDGPDLPVDWNHSEARTAPNGESSPAAGWIDRLEVRDGAIFARVEWTEDGRESIKSRSYRYFSPEFIPTRKGEVYRILGGSLVNRPALDMPSLADSQRHDTASLIARIEALEEKIGVADEERIKGTVAAELDAAQSTGMITPAERRYHENAIGNTESGLLRFRSFVIARSKIHPGGILASYGNHLSRPPDSKRSGDRSLDKVAKLLGRSPEWIKQNQ